MPTAQQLQASRIYAGLMEEAKVRISAIDAGTGHALPLPPLIVREHCYLQLRMICEIIALGCLIAHGDITATGRLRAEWAADRIMDGLERLHPDFYPVPVRQENPNNWGEITGVSQNPLPKGELLKLYRGCGSILHRGSQETCF